MADTKKKDAAETNVNLFTQDDYIAVRSQLQADTHLARLLDWLWFKGSITSMECFVELHNTRVGSTIGLLRHEYNVPTITEMITAKIDGMTVRYGKYSIEKETDKHVQV